MIFSVGRLAVKVAGRDAGRKCVVVEQVDDQFVIVDGNVRRKRVNVKHLEPLAESIDIKNKASHADVKKAFEKLGVATWERKSKKATERPKKVKAKKERVVEEKAPKVEKKPEQAEPKAEEPTKDADTPKPSEKKE